MTARIKAYSWRSQLLIHRSTITRSDMHMHRPMSPKCINPIPLSPSKRFRNLPSLHNPSLRIPKLPPRNRIHQSPHLTPCHHNPQLVPARSQIIIQLIPQTNNHPSNHNPNPKTRRTKNFILLRRPDIFSPNHSRPFVCTHRTFSRTIFFVND